MTLTELLIKQAEKNRTQEELLHCPFCGGIPTLRRSYSRYHVLHSCQYMVYGAGFSGKKESIEKWNTRYVAKKDAKKDKE